MSINKEGVQINLPVREKIGGEIFLTKEFINILMSIMELNDPYLTKHQKRVKRLAVRIASEMKLSSYELKLIEIAALIHDIGKINVPNELLYKPGTISDLEFEVIKEHPEIGSQLIRPKSEMIADIILQHHERINGSGYPAGKEENEILIEAKIIAIADTIEAMSFHRPYRPERGVKQALKEVKKNQGVLYDQQAAEVCLDLFREQRFEF